MHTLEILSYWVRDLWKAALLILVLIGLFVWLGIWATGSEPRLVSDEGEVVRFGGRDGKFGPRLLVLVRVRDGRVLQLAAGRAKMRDCRPGSRIRLIWRDARATVHPAGCTSHAP